MLEKPSTRKILLALDASARSRAALQMAATLAVELNVELTGLFVEDIDLLQLSGLPFTRETRLFSSSLRPMVQQEVEQALRREADGVRRLLAETAARSGLRWSFHVVRGQISTEIFAMASEPGLIVLGKCARRGLRLLGDSLAEPGSSPRRPGSVMAVFDGSIADSPAIALASRLSCSIGAELRLLIPGTAEQFARHIDEAKTLLNGMEIPQPVFQRIATDEIVELAAAAQAAHAAVLVLGGDSRFRGKEGFAILLNSIDCPVVLVRSI